VAKYFANTTSEVLTGAVSNPSRVPIFFSSAKSLIVMMGKMMMKPIQNHPESKRLYTKLCGLTLVRMALTMLENNHPFKRMTNAITT